MPSIRGCRKRRLASQIRRAGVVAERPPAGATARDWRRTEAFLAERIIVYWRDIPAQVIVRQGRRTAKRELPERFVKAIDQSAMRIGAVGTDAYLAEWRRGTPEPCGDDLEAEADAALARLENDYGRDRLRQLVDNGGRQAE
jgi:hypothetical protein